MYGGQTLYELLEEDESCEKEWFNNKFKTMTKQEQQDWLNKVIAVMHNVRGVRFVCKAGCTCRADVTKVPETI